jgi:N-acylneuraminate cytidylyltransferase
MDYAKIGQLVIKENFMTTYAIIPARGGSKGVPGKNIKLLGGFPLVAYSVVAARLAAGIDRVVISTDSEEIAAVAKKYGADVPFIRPAELAQDRSPDRDFVVHAIEWFASHEGKVPDFLVHLRPTTPLRDPIVVSRAVEMFVNSADATSLRSAHPCPESPFKWFLLKEDGFYTGIQTDDMDLLNQPRQMFPTVYVPDGYVDVLRTSFVTASHTIHGKKVLGYVSPFCLEVDTFEDFQALEFQLQREGSPLLDYLKNNFTPEG